MAGGRWIAAGAGSRVKVSTASRGTGYEKGLIPVDRSMKGCGAAGNSLRAASRSPPCHKGAAEPVRNSMVVWLALLALLIELMVGYPDRLARAIGHPVSWIGRLIDALDIAWNRPSAADGTRRFMGVLAVLLIVAVAGGAAFGLWLRLRPPPFGLILLAPFAPTPPAQRSPHAHVARGAPGPATNRPPAGAATPRARARPMPDIPRPR